MLTQTANDQPAHRNYLLSACAACALLLVATLSINTVIDPLWYQDGNARDRRNFVFNERVSKANLVERGPAEFDCVILGSSRATLLDAKSVKGHRCFNFAVSNGQASEMLAIGRWFAARTRGLKLVIVGVDGFNFIEHSIPPVIPDFVEADTAPPNLLAAYMSIDVLKFSMRTLIGWRQELGRVYLSPDFECVWDDGLGSYEAPSHVDPKDRFGGLPSVPSNLVGPFRADRASLFAEISRDFPSAEVVGYVPPLVVDYFDHVAAHDFLKGYLESIWRVAHHFDRFRDFSIPSELTTDPNNTYDGSHFSREANNSVAAWISGDEGVGVDVKALDLPAYRQTFEAALARHSRESRPLIAGSHR